MSELRGAGPRHTGYELTSAVLAAWTNVHADDWDALAADEQERRNEELALAVAALADMTARYEADGRPGEAEARSRFDHLARLGPALELCEYAWHRRECAAIDADGEWVAGNAACSCGYDDARRALDKAEEAAK